ncbi:response regulator [Rhizobium sp. P40RR-XXII]|uniref:response regulator n=1 Tax=Rhizobium sp. P40RR-XXII TaxID=2726739 RepID=UPI001456E288|nr:response regulator [Rhizobium sp. P40RR-XXII]NLS20284.1 response regulator [Rhizobium sp. P40RR-XXII]
MVEGQPKTARGVLVVEADADLRLRIVEEIKAAGLGTAQASNGDEAIGVLQRRADIGLVFTAVNMSGSIDGLGLAVRIHRTRPDLAIVITSAMVNLRQSSLPRRCRFLRKPYEPGNAIKCFRLLLEMDAYDAAAAIV